MLTTETLNEKGAKRKKALNPLARCPSCGSGQVGFDPMAFVQRFDSETEVLCYKCGWKGALLDALPSL